MFSFVFILISIIHLNKCQFFDDFCDYSNIEFVFNYQNNICLTNGVLMWTYDNSSGYITEMPLNQTQVFGYQLMSSISITKVPECSSNQSDSCTDYQNAMNMSFLIIYSHGYQYITERQSIGEITINPKDMPWNISSDGFDIWPHIIANDLTFIGVYWPQEYEIIFLINNGDINDSAIVYNTMFEKYWWKQLKRSPLKSNVFFNGLFHLNNNIYAIGSGNQMFELNINEFGERSLKMIGQNVTEFFRCSQRPQVIHGIVESLMNDQKNKIQEFSGLNDSDITDTTIITPSPSPPTPDSNIVTIVICIIAGILLLAAICCGIMVLIKYYSKEKTPKKTIKKRILENELIEEEEEEDGEENYSAHNYKIKLRSLDTIRSKSSSGEGKKRTISEPGFTVTKDMPKTLSQPILIQSKEQLKSEPKILYKASDESFKSLLKSNESVNKTKQNQKNVKQKSKIDSKDKDMNKKSE